VHRDGAHLAGRCGPGPHRGRRRRCHAVRAPGRQVRQESRLADRALRQQGNGHHPGAHQGHRGKRCRPVRAHGQENSRRLRGDHHRRASALPDDAGRGTAVSGDQRQRFRHQVEVRQPLRLPGVPGRRHQARHRRDGGRQGRGGRRLR